MVVTNKTIVFINIVLFKKIKWKNTLFRGKSRGVSFFEEYSHISVGRLYETIWQIKKYKKLTGSPQWRPCIILILISKKCLKYMIAYV